MTTGERIHNRRIEIGLSVNKVADLIGKDRATVYRYESDDIENLPVSVLEPLAKALKTTPAYLMGWEDDYLETEEKPAENNITEKEQDIIIKYRSLDDYGKKNVDTLLDNEYERCTSPKDTPVKRTNKELIEEIENQNHFQLIAYGGRKLNRTVSKEKAMETKRLIEEIEKKKEDKAAKLREQFEEIERKQKEESLRKQEMFRKMAEKAENSHNEE